MKHFCKFILCHVIDITWISSHRFRLRTFRTILVNVRWSSDRNRIGCRKYWAPESPLINHSRAKPGAEYTARPLIGIISFESWLYLQLKIKKGIFFRKPPYFEIRAPIEAAETKNIPPKILTPSLTPMIWQK